MMAPDESLTTPDNVLLVVWPHPSETAVIASVNRQRNIIVLSSGAILLHPEPQRRATRSGEATPAGAATCCLPSRRGHQPIFGTSGAVRAGHRFAALQPMRLHCRWSAL